MQILRNRLILMNKWFAGCDNVKLFELHKNTGYLPWAKRIYELTAVTDKHRTISTRGQCNGHTKEGYKSVTPYMKQKKFWFVEIIRWGSYIRVERVIKFWPSPYLWNHLKICKTCRFSKITGEIIPQFGTDIRNWAEPKCCGPATGLF